MTDCSAPGANLERLHVLPSFWRQSTSSRYIRACPMLGDGSTACLGGPNISDQCALGHAGPLCDLCEVGYYGGKGTPCVECGETDEADIVAPIVAGQAHLRV